MSTPAPGSDNRALLNAFLLREQLLRFTDPRIPRALQEEAQLALEYFLIRQEPSIVGALEEALDSRLLDQPPWPEAMEWYLDFLSGKPESWLRHSSPVWLRSRWREFQISRIQALILDTILLVEYASDVPAVGSQVAELFNDAGDVERRFITQALLRHVNLGSVDDLSRRSLPLYSALCLKVSLYPVAGPVPETVIEEALRFSNLGARRLNELLMILRQAG